MLKKEAHFAVELFPLPGQDLCRRQLHGGVAVMAAGVHDARRLGGEGQSCLLGDGQGVDIRPQGDGGAGVGAPQHCHHAGLGGALELQAGNGPQMLQQEIRGAELLERQLRRRMQLPPPGDELGLQSQDLL